MEERCARYWVISVGELSIRPMMEERDGLRSRRGGRWDGGDGMRVMSGEAVKRKERCVWVERRILIAFRVWFRRPSVCLMVEKREDRKEWCCECCWRMW
jgi:hypothetical protein